MIDLLSLSGYPGSGKDTIADHLVEHYGFTRIAFADPVRKALLALNPMVIGPLGFIMRVSDLVERHGWTEAKKNPDVRELLQRMGTEAGREIHGTDCWERIAERKIRKAEGPVVLTDTRFPNEIALVDRFAREGKSVLKLCIERPGHGPVNDHASEKMDYRAMTDGCILNSGSLAELYDDIECLLRLGAYTP